MKYLDKFLAKSSQGKNLPLNVPHKEPSKPTKALLKVSWGGDSRSTGGNSSHFGGPSSPTIQEVDTSPNGKAIESIDSFFTKEILPRLSGLSRNGRLPDLAKCSHWASAERLWDTLSLDSELPSTGIEEIKAAMRKAIDIYEGKKLF